MPKRNLYLLSVLSGILLSLGWPHNGFAPLLFIAFVPLLLVEYEVYYNAKAYKKISLFGFAYAAFFVWNLITTYWVCYASVGGGVMAIVTNSLLMAIVFVLHHHIKKKTAGKFGSRTLVVFWLTFEYIHYHWDIAWPWLTLGNGFANYYKWIQWYEYTGVFGGSLWIWAVNILIFELIKRYIYEVEESPRRRTVLLSTIGILLLPILFSYFIYNHYDEKYSPVNVVVVQPNVDPYHSKFNISYQEQLDKMLKMAGERVDSTTDYLVFPETALTEGIWEENISSAYSINVLKRFLRFHPKLKIVIGASTSKTYEGESIPSETARKFVDADSYYDSYNTALQVDASDKIKIYHKSRLVPGVEKMPWPMLLKPIEALAIDLGGTTGSLGTQDERTVFLSPTDDIKISPIICYESIFGEFVTEYVNNGAQLIFIITNDGWWDDTPGYKQHLNYASLRAIETRRSIARSANTGISCFINQKGDVSKLTGWWEPDVIKASINANDEETFYAKNGDYIARLCVLISVVFLIYYLFFHFYGKRNNNLN